MFISLRNVNALNIKGLSVFFVALLLSGGAFSADFKALSYLLCKRNMQVRALRIDQVKSNCVATYTKSGIDTIVGKFSQEDQCREVLDKIKVTLEKTDWKCKDISQSRVSYSGL